MTTASLSVAVRSKTINITEKTGNLVAIKEVIDTDDLMIINKSGITIRIQVADLRVMGRATQGVKVIRLNDGDQISSVEKIEQLEEESTEKIEGADDHETFTDNKAEGSDQNSAETNNE